MTESPSSSRLCLTVGEDILNVEIVSADAEAERSKARKVVLGKLELIHDARAFLPGHRVCTINEWVDALSTIHCIVHLPDQGSLMWHASRRGRHRHALLLYLCQYLFLHLFCLRLRLCMASPNTFTTKHLDLYSIPDIKADSRGTPVDT